MVVRRQLPDSVSLERDRDGLDPGRLLFFHVVQRQEPAECFDAIDDALSQWPAVDLAGPVRGDCFQGRRIIGVAEPLAGGRCVIAVDQKSFSRPFIFFQQLSRGIPVARNDGRHREPAIGELDRRRECLGEREGAVAREERLPSGDGARHDDRFHAGVRHRRAATRDERFACHQGPRSPARIEPDELVVFRRPDDGEDVTAGPSHHGLDQPKDRRRSHGRVDGVSTVFQHSEPGSTRERLTRGDDAVGCIDG